MMTLGPVAAYLFECS